MSVQLTKDHDTKQATVYKATRFDSPIKSLYIATQALQDQFGEVPQEITVTVEK